MIPDFLDFCGSLSVIIEGYFLILGMMIEAGVYNIALW